MRFALLAAIVLPMTAAGLAGCLEGDLTLMTAKQALGKADREAADWADDAQLIGAFGMEAGAEARAMVAEMSRQEAQPGAPDAGEEDDAQSAVFGPLAGTEDDDVGDGHAPVWVFTYSSASKDTMLWVAVSSEGARFGEEGDGDETAFGPGGGKAVEGWAIDSDKGADVALLDESYAHAVADENALVYTMLFQGTKGPVWIFGSQSSSDDGGGESIVAVSAVDGEVIDAAQVLGEVLGFVPREAGTASGSMAGAVMSSFSSSFDIQIGGHGLLAVLVSVTPPPLVPMQVTVSDPDGTEYTATIDPAVAVDSSASVVINAVLTGEYGVSVASDVVVASDWEISWCTDGEAFAPIPSPACEVVDSATHLAAPTGRSLWETLSPLGRSPWA